MLYSVFFRSYTKWKQKSEFHQSRTCNILWLNILDSQLKHLKCYWTKFQKRDFQRVSSLNTHAFAIRSWPHWFCRSSLSFHAALQGKLRMKNGPPSTKSAPRNNIMSALSMQTATTKFSWTTGKFCHQISLRLDHRCTFCSGSMKAEILKSRKAKKGKCNKEVGNFTRKKLYFILQEGYVKMWEQRFGANVCFSEVFDRGSVRSLVFTICANLSWWNRLTHVTRASPALSADDTLPPTSAPLHPTSPCRMRHIHSPAEPH